MLMTRDFDLVLMETIENRMIYQFLGLHNEILGLVLLEKNFACKQINDEITKRKKRICGREKSLTREDDVYFVHSMNLIPHPKYKPEEIEEIFWEILLYEKKNLAMFANERTLQSLSNYDFDIAFEYNSNANLTILSEKVREAIKTSDKEKFSKLLLLACRYGLGYSEDEKCLKNPDESCYKPLSTVGGHHLYNDGKSGVYITLRKNKNNCGPHKMILGGSVRKGIITNDEESIIYFSKDCNVQWRVDENKVCKKIRNSKEEQDCNFELRSGFSKKVLKMSYFVSATSLYFDSNYETYFVKMNNNVKMNEFPIDLKRNDNPFFRSFINNPLFDKNILTHVINPFLGESYTSNLGYIIKKEDQINDFDIDKIVDIFFQMTDNYYIWEDLRIYKDGSIFPGTYSVYLFDLKPEKRQYLTIKSFYHLYVYLSSIYKRRKKEIYKKICDKLKETIKEDIISKYFMKPSKIKIKDRNILKKNIPLIFMQYFDAKDYKKCFHVQRPTKKFVDTNILKSVKKMGHEKFHELFKYEAKNIFQLKFASYLLEYFDAEIVRYYDKNVPLSLKYIQWDDEYFMKLMKEKHDINIGNV